MTHAELEDWVVRFTDAFNREDLDGVMAFFADDGIYDEFNGTRRVIRWLCTTERDGVGAKP